MGQHFGTIASTGTAEELLAALGAAGTFKAGREIAAFEDAPETDAAGERTLFAGDDRGVAYLLDDSLVLSTDADLIIDTSRRLDRLVMSAGAETTSGTYFLIAADRGELRRLHWNLIGAMSEPYDVGSPLAGEPEDGLDDVDGERLARVLAAAGFDDRAWQASGRKLIVDADYAPAVAGPVGNQLNAFVETHLVPGGDQVKPIVASRDGGYDLVAPGTRMPDGSRVGEKKSGMLGRLFGRG